MPAAVVADGAQSPAHVAYREHVEHHNEPRKHGDDGLVPKAGEEGAKPNHS
jgi:hypothetical protein